MLSLTGKIIVPALLWVLSLPVEHVVADESNCIRTTDNWITKSAGDRKILQNHVQANCDFAASWIKRYTGNSAKTRQSLCNDLVLIWTHKKCIFFRDYIDHGTYEPCKKWSREMFNQCINHNDRWFSE